MKKIDHSASAAPVVSEGGRSPSTLSTDQPSPIETAAPAVEPGASKVGPLAPGQRWSVARKREVVLRLLRGESAELLSRELGLPIFKLEQWRQKADAALDGALKAREVDPANVELAAAMQRIGELSMEVELLRAKMERPTLWPGGGRADGQDDFRGDRPALWRQARLPGLGRAPLQLLRRPDAEAGRTPSLGRRRDAGRNRPSPTRPCSPPSSMIWRRRHGPARDTARSGRVFASGTAFASPASGCCA